MASHTIAPLLCCEKALTLSAAIDPTMKKFWSCLETVIVTEACLPVQVPERRCQVLPQRSAGAGHQSGIDD